MHMLRCSSYFLHLLGIYAHAQIAKLGKHVWTTTMLSTQLNAKTIRNAIRKTHQAATPTERQRNSLARCRISDTPRHSRAAKEQLCKGTCGTAVLCQGHHVQSCASRCEIHRVLSCGMVTMNLHLSVSIGASYSRAISV